MGKHIFLPSQQQSSAERPLPPYHMMKCGVFFVSEGDKVEASESRKTETSNGGKAFSSHTLYPRGYFLDLRGMINLN